MLRLTKKADYSLIALTFLAAKYEDPTSQAASAKEIADTYGIPLPLLSKILQKLTKSGFLASEFGANGGYRLSRRPSQISSLEVIKAIDGPIILTECFAEDHLADPDHSSCDHTVKCSVRRPLQRIHEGILQLLSSVTIEDMLHGSADRPTTPSAPLIGLSEIRRSPEVYGSPRRPS